MKAYSSLDELEKDYPAGTQIRFKLPEWEYSRAGMVAGFVHSLPLHAGGDPLPALVLVGGGHVYPHEVVASSKSKGQ